MRVIVMTHPTIEVEEGSSYIVVGRISPHSGAFSLVATFDHDTPAYPTIEPFSPLAQGKPGVDRIGYTYKPSVVNGIVEREVTLDIPETYDYAVAKRTYTDKGGRGSGWDTEILFLPASVNETPAL